MNEEIVKLDFRYFLKIEKNLREWIEENFRRIFK